MTSTETCIRESSEEESDLIGDFPESWQVVQEGEECHAQDVHLGPSVRTERASPERSTHRYIPLHRHRHRQVDRASLRYETQREDEGRHPLVDPLAVPHHRVCVLADLRQAEHEH